MRENLKKSSPKRHKQPIPVYECNVSYMTGICYIVNAHTRIVHIVN